MTNNQANASCFVTFKKVQVFIDLQILKVCGNTLGIDDHKRIACN